MLNDCFEKQPVASFSGTYWSQRFLVPIPIPSGDPLVTLRNAGAYISRLSEPVYRTEHWRVATHLLIEAAEGTVSTELARFSIVTAVDHEKTMRKRGLD
jgi:hypothetical protein